MIYQSLLEITGMAGIPFPFLAFDDIDMKNHSAKIRKPDVCPAFLFCSGGRI